MQVREYFLGEGTGPRRLAVMPDDIIYYTDYFVIADSLNA